jgi:hypothetical protein
MRHLMALLFRHLAPLTSTMLAAEKVHYLAPPEFSIPHTHDRSFIGPGMFVFENGDILFRLLLSHAGNAARRAADRSDFVGEFQCAAFGHDGKIAPGFDPDHHGLAGFGNTGIFKRGKCLRRPMCSHLWASPTLKCLGLSTRSKSTNRI